METLLLEQLIFAEHVRMMDQTEKANTSTKCKSDVNLSEKGLLAFEDKCSKYKHEAHCPNIAHLNNSDCINIFQMVYYKFNSQQIL